MAKFYEFTGYLLDVNEEFPTFKDYLDYINQRKYGSDINAFNVKCIQFEWDDNINLNKSNCTKEEMSSYFPVSDPVYKMGLCYCKECIHHNDIVNQKSGQIVMCKFFNVPMNKTDFCNYSKKI